MGAQNFNLAPKFAQYGGFQPHILHFWMKNFPSRRKFSDYFQTALKLGEAIAS